MPQSRIKPVKSPTENPATAKAEFLRRLPPDLAKNPNAKALAGIFFDNINAEDWAQQPHALFQTMFAALWPSLLQFKGKQPVIDIKKLGQGGPNDCIVTIICPDRPFLVDSTTNALHDAGLELELVVYPLAYVTGTGQGITAIAAQNKPALAKPGHSKPEKPLCVSLTQFLIRTPVMGWSAETATEKLSASLADVALAVDDWQGMRSQLQHVIEELSPSPHAEAAEVIAFLRWLDADHFTFLGYRRYTYPKSGGNGRIEHVANSGLGLIRDGERRVFGDLRERDTQAPELQQFVNNKHLISLAKSSARSTVHRHVPMDVVSIKQFDDKGRAVGEHRFIGLFTSLSYTRHPRDIPILRRKVEWVVEQTGWSKSGHKAKILLDVLSSYPRDELFQLEQDELLPTALGITRIQEKIRTALFLRQDKFGRYFSALIYTPREGFSADLREKFGAILLRHLGGSIRSFYTQISDQPLARIHFIIDSQQPLIFMGLAQKLEQALADAARGWCDRLQESLLDTFGPDRAAALWQRYQRAFGQEYQNLRTPQMAAADITAVEAIITDKAVAKDCQVRLDGDSIILYQQATQLALSDILPGLENLGLRVLHETALPIQVPLPGGTTIFWLHQLAVRAAHDESRDLTPIAPILAEAIGGIRSHLYEDDGFNRLVTALAIPARQAAIFRLYAQYLRQIGFSASLKTMQSCLIAHPAISLHLRDLFFAQYDPKTADPLRAAKLQADILIQLDHLGNAEDDRILRRFLNLIQATLRTNFFQTDAQGKPKDYIACKFACEQITDMPQPKLWREIFISSPRFEAVHLRGGKVARGGIRWSDRRDDFRTEVLGLVKAQMVKNTVIVPVGSKGGFVLKQAPTDKAAYAAFGVQCYQDMLRGMLDITDNWRGGKIVPPQNVVRLDEDDAYLVVAADKGTAKFSDYANAVSAEYDFWLGDAFASGGSAGYDHKELAITARGGWVAVERHFRELGHDIGQENFTTIGIGDMAGDVFGNGVLRSKNMRLIAAFNHSHIFIDPNPDPAKSFAERQRLFQNPQLTWADYNPKILSKGGGVYSRDAKKIVLSPEAQKALDINQTECTPTELMQHILRAPVDLLWLGGIGTFVRASSENNIEVGDRSNDAIRVEARELRVKIVGEGANLGMTQRGRIEYAQLGGRINTDAIDNSGGVDTSDHEVNIKILLGAVERTGKLTRPMRNKLLRSMSEDVCHLVLRDNYEQTMILSLLAAEAAERGDEYAALMRQLEASAKLNRKIEFLPNDIQLAERAKAKQFLTRPELAVILAYAKMGLYESLVASAVPDDPALIMDLEAYFPQPVQKKYGAAIARHPLRREIISTQLTNQLINRLGVLLPYQLAEQSGHSLAEVARAYVAMREIFGFENSWQEICALDNKAKPPVQTHLALAQQRLAERGIAWLLRQTRPKAQLDDMLRQYQKPLQQIQAAGMAVFTTTDRPILDRKIADYTRQNVPQALATRVVIGRMWGGAGDIVHIAADLKFKPLAVAELYYAIGEAFELDWLRRICAKLPRGNAWQSRAQASLLDDLLGLQARLTKDIARRYGAKPQALGQWRESRTAQLQPIHRMLEELRLSPQLDTAMITVAIAKIRMLLS